MTAAVAVVGSALATFLAWRLWFFFRDPDRVPPDAPGLVAAADGTVVYVLCVRAGEVPLAHKRGRPVLLEEHLRAPGPLPGDGVLVGTYMSVLSVHRNRVPVDGVVVLREHRPAVRSRSMVRMMVQVLLRRPPYEAGCRHVFENERLTLGIRAAGGTVFVTQIADAWISSIVAEPTVGQTVRRGARYGMIRFGSQVDVFVPDSLGLAICVQPGQRVRAGETLLATPAPRAAT